uniref:Uncharacterized protein n=1 Tax=Cannabis sativa TaxID=3483 RepID=A0A803QZ47_CANSA
MAPAGKERYYPKKLVHKQCWNWISISDCGDVDGKCNEIIDMIKCNLSVHQKCWRIFQSCSTLGQLENDRLPSCRIHVDWL